MIANLIQSRYLLWLILSIPALPFIDEFINQSRYYPEVMQRTGLISVQLLVLTLSITPITLLLKPFAIGRAVSRWLLAKRKYFGLFSALYALIHTLLYLREIEWDWYLAWLEGLDWPFATGWIAFLLFCAVALISNKTGIKLLGQGWKPIQRLTYPIAILVFVHWLLLDPFVGDPLIWIVPLVVLKLIHTGFRINQSFSNSANSRRKLAK